MDELAEEVNERLLILTDDERLEFLAMLTYCFYCGKYDRDNTCRCWDDS